MITIRSKTSLTVFLASLVASIACSRHDDKPHYSEKWKEFDTAADTESGLPAKKSRPEDPAGTGVRPGGELDADTVVYKAKYQGRILKDKIRFLNDRFLFEPTRVKPEDDSLLYNFIKDDLNYLSSQPINLMVSLTLGDGEKSMFSQRVDSPTDDPANKAKTSWFGTNEKPGRGPDSSSGVMVYERVASNDNCPEGIVCIGKIVTKPDKGIARTYCFVDKKTQKVTAIPLGAAPGATPDDIKKMPKRFGPYLVRRYSFMGLECDDTFFKPDDQSEILVVMDLEEDEGVLKEVSRRADNDRIDYGVSFSILKMNGEKRLPDDQEPYIDTLVGMQAKTVYYFNGLDNSLVLIKKELRKAIKLAYFLNGLSGYYGLVAEIDFRFCKDLIAENQKDQCETSKNVSSP